MTRFQYDATRDRVVEATRQCERCGAPGAHVTRHGDWLCQPCLDRGAA